MNIVPITRAIAKASLKLDKASPNLLFAVGLGGVIVGTVLACKATLQIEDVLDEGLNNLEYIDSVSDSDPAQIDVVREKTIAYADMTFQIAKLYGPALIVGGIGVACLTGSHRVLTKRNAALTVAYAALERSYNAYRDHVREAFGDDKEREVHYLVTKDLAEQDRKVVDGSKKKPPKVDYSVYAKFFDEANPNWTRSPEKNLMFLNVQQSVANDILHSRGYLLLNDVYDMLGFPRTTAGCVVGWTMYEDGDNYVDFGVFNHHTDEVRAFVNGIEKCILLDFNVDGVVYEKIER